MRRSRPIALPSQINVYRGDKMAHFAVSFLRQAPGQAWTRIEGLPTGDELLEQYHRLAAGG
jgi:hypothetical protein